MKSRQAWPSRLAGLFVLGVFVAAAPEARAGVVNGVPTIQVVSPNGGEVWTMGSEYRITWTASDLAPSGSLQIFWYDGKTWTYVDAVPQGTTEYVWLVPAQATTQAMVAVGNGIGGSWEAYDQSDAFFSIVVAPTAAKFFTVSPCRAVDTRNPIGTLGGPALAANAKRVFPIAGVCGIPATAKAVAVNITAVNVTDTGDLRLYPAGGSPPAASSINFSAGQIRASDAITSLGSGGQVAVQCDMAPGSNGHTDLLLDVTGYFK